MSQVPASFPVSFSNQLLIALPALDDPQFARSVALICQHDDEGAMGVVVNRASEYSLGEVLAQMNLEARDRVLANQIVLNGGPVHPERGFVLHDGERQWDSTLAIGGGLALTTSRDILEAMAEDPNIHTVVYGQAYPNMVDLASPVGLIMKEIPDKYPDKVFLILSAVAGKVQAGYRADQPPVDPVMSWDGLQHSSCRPRRRMRAR